MAARRLVTLDDRATAPEEITVLEPPTRFAYTLSDFSPPFGRLVRGATGEWRNEGRRGHPDRLEPHLQLHVAAAARGVAV